jgi:hypothetical protein
MGVATKVIVGLEERDLASLLPKQPRASQPGDAGANDRDAHRFPSLKVWREQRVNSRREFSSGVAPTPLMSAYAR